MQCVASGLTREEVASVRALFRTKRKRWRTVLPPADPSKEPSCSVDGAGEEDGGSAFFYDEEHEPEGEQRQKLLRRTLQRSDAPLLEQIASKLEALVARVVGEAGWGFEPRIGHEDEKLQFNRYLAGGFSPLHRDAFAGVAHHIEPDAPVDWSLEHPRGNVNFTQVSRRLMSVIVQLAAPAEYTGGELQLFPGTAGEPALAQRRPDESGEGRLIINAVRRGQPVQPAPRCPGDVVIFPGLVPHTVTPVRSGARESLVWWVHGTPPASGIWAGRSPWLDARTGGQWAVNGPIISGDG